MEKILDTDVLVIGGGFAGCWAAIRAKDFTDKVILVDKAKVARSGCSTFAAGVQLCPLPEDDLDLWKKEIVEAGDYFPNQEWLDPYLRNQIERIKDYERWGAPLERDSSGKIARIVGRGHINTRLFQFHGPKLMEILRQQVLQRGVKLLERVMIAELLTSENSAHSGRRIAGALGLNTRTGVLQVFRAKAVVMAAGPVNSKRWDVHGNCTGDGIGAAFRAGAEVTNMEFATTGNITIWERKGKACGINMIQGYGAHFVNARGERFMGKYDPILWERSALYKLGMGFAKEALEGRGPIYVDMTHFAPEIFDRFRRVLPRPMEFWDKLGIDLSKQKIECTPSWGVGAATGQGGIKVDHNCQTNIPGLYAAGAVTRMPSQGIYAVGGVATSTCNVMGYIAGERAAQYALGSKVPETSTKQVEDLKREIGSPSNRKDGISASDLFLKLNAVTTPAPFSMFKNETRIIKVLSQIEGMKEALPKVVAPDSHELVKANEIRNLLLCSELVFRAALERKESRQYHYREEYPYRDDIEWLKLIIFKKEGERLITYYEPIPVDNWPIKPERRVKISHPIQMFLGE